MSSYCKKKRKNLFLFWLYTMVNNNATSKLQCELLLSSTGPAGFFMHLLVLEVVPRKYQMCPNETLTRRISSNRHKRVSISFSLHVSDCTLTTYKVYFRSAMILVQYWDISDWYQPSLSESSQRWDMWVSSKYLWLATSFLTSPMTHLKRNRQHRKELFKGVCSAVKGVSVLSVSTFLFTLS